MSNGIGEVVKDLAIVMQKPWFEKHRPETIDDVVFESPIVEQKIRDFLSQGYISGNMLSYGPGGTGKTTINKVLAWAIIKSEADLFILGKGVKDVEDLKVIWTSYLNIKKESKDLREKLLKWMRTDLNLKYKIYRHLHNKIVPELTELV